MAKTKRKLVTAPDASEEVEKKQIKVKEEEGEEEEASDSDDGDEEDEVEVEVEVEDEDEDEDDEDDDEDEEEEEVDFSSRESIMKLLEPFGKDQLIELLKEAALKDPSLVARISASAESDPAHRKIFVHGLGWDATSEVLSAAFASYGEIEECRAVLDRATGRCKGFGFLLFRSRAAARRALKEPQKMIGGRLTSCQLASFGAPTAHPVPEGTGRKIFISGIADNISPERLRAFFAKFGEIEEGPLGYDRATGKLRGFAIFVYKTVDGCKKALEEPTKVFEGCQLRCQRALEGLKPKTPFQAPGNMGVVPGVLQPNDLTLNYAAASMLGMNPMAGLVGQNLNPASASLLGQNAGAVTPSPYGVGSGLGDLGSGFNSMSPSVIGSYGSQTALQGIGAYQRNQFSSPPAMKSQYGNRDTGLPPYLGR